MLLVSFADFFQNHLFQKIISGTLPECQMVWIQIRTDTMSVLIWLQTVCKGYQQTTKVTTSKERVNQPITTWWYSKTCLKWPLKPKTKIGFQDRLSLNAAQKYCRMLQGEHSAIPLTFIKLPLVIKIFVLSIFEWLPKTGFTVYTFCTHLQEQKLFST